MLIFQTLSSFEIAPPLKVISPIFHCPIILSYLLHNFTSWWPPIYQINQFYPICLLLLSLPTLLGSITTKTQCNHSHIDSPLSCPLCLLHCLGTAQPWMNQAITLFLYLNTECCQKKNHTTWLIDMTHKYIATNLNCVLNITNVAIFFGVIFSILIPFSPSSNFPTLLIHPDVSSPETDHESFYFVF